MLPLLKVYCFGPFYAEINGQPLSGFRTEKTQALLAYLALEGSRPLRRTQLANLLWHGYQSKTALASLRVALGNLRQLLVPLGLLQTTRQTIRWTGATPEVWCDALEFSAVCSAPVSATPAQIRAGLQLYNGEFLAGYEDIDSQPFQEWLAAQRAHYRAQAEQLRQRLAGLLTMQPQRPPRNLPRIFTPLFGRDAQIAEVCGLLLEANRPLVTLLGEGGIGKTRLALAVAQSIYNVTSPTAGSGAPPPDVTAKFADGLWFVPLAGVAPLHFATQDVNLNDAVQTEEIIADAIGKALGLSFAGSEPLRSQLCNQLQHKSLLLLLDNFEHLIQGRNLLVTLLQRAQSVSILVTTRQRLYLQAESIYHVAELPVPDLAQASGGQWQATTYPSVQLFVERARNTTAGFALTPSNQAEVAQICAKLGGMPLALELAAAQIETQTPAAILRNLQANVISLATNLADVTPRHRDLRQVLAASWNLLTPTEAQILAQCSIFHGGFTLEAAAAVCANIADIMEEQHLSALIDKSLLQRTAEGRYALHEVVRQYAAEQLQQAEKAAQGARQRHTDYFATLLQREFTQIYTTPTAQQRIQADLANIRRAWQWMVAEVHWANLNRSVLPFALFQFYAGTLQEMQLLSEAAIAHLRPYLPVAKEPLPWRVYGLLLAILAYYDGMLGRVTKAETLARQAHQIGQDIADGEVQMLAFLPLNLLARVQSRLTIEQAQQAVTLAQRYADQPPHLIVQFLGDLGRALTSAGRTDEAVKTYEAGIQLAYRYQVHVLSSILLYQYSQLQARLGDWAQVYQLAQQALTIHQSWHYFVGVTHSSLSLAHYAYALGDYPQALQWAQQALRQSRAGQSYESECRALVWQSKAQARLGQAAEAQRNLDAAVVLSEKLGNRAYQAWAQVERGRVALLQHEWENAQTAGQAALTLASYPEAAEYGAAARAVLAWAYLRQQQLAAAQAEIGAILQLFQQVAAGLPHNERAWVYWACVEILHNAKDPQAQTVLGEARLWLQTEAAKISDAAIRQTFLTNVPEHQLLTSAEYGAQGAPGMWSNSTPDTIPQFALRIPHFI